MILAGHHSFDTAGSFIGEVGVLPGIAVVNSGANNNSNLPFSSRLPGN